MKITIVTVCYNAGEVLERTINSVLAQSYNNIEYIIIDGASSDNTADILKRYSDNIDIIISEPDNGIYDAMNKAIAIATGEYINFMNAGDFFSDNDVVEKIVAEIEEDTDVIFGNSTVLYGNNKKKKLKVTDPIELLRKRPIYRHNASFTRSSLHKKFPFDLSKSKDFKYGLDYNHIFNIWRRKAVFKKSDIDVVTWLKDGVSDRPVKNVIVCYKISHQFSSPSAKERVIFLYDLLKACRREILKFIH